MCEVFFGSGLFRDSVRGTVDRLAGIRGKQRSRSDHPPWTAIGLALFDDDVLLVDLLGGLRLKTGLLAM